MLLNSDDPESVIRQLDQKVIEEIDENWEKIEGFKIKKNLDLKFEDVIKKIENQKKEKFTMIKSNFRRISLWVEI